MKVIILAGGRGTRLSEETETKPKPMIEIGERPILWHIMKFFASAGHHEFFLALGYKGEVIKNYFLNYHYLQDDFSISLSNGEIRPHNPSRDNWKIHLIDTGLETGTGGRLKRLASWIKKDKEPFFMTYGDGLCNVDLKKLTAFHRQHKKLATVTAVRPPSRFGGLEFQSKRNIINQFNEKPQIAGGWINGGFFILEPEIFDYIDGDEMMFEREPLERLAQDGQLIGYRHDDFWQCMDTLRDVQLLESLWKNNDAKWKIWKD